MGLCHRLENSLSGFRHPDVLAALAAGTEFQGGILLIVGFAVRWISIPLMFSLLFTGAGRHVSLDYRVRQWAIARNSEVAQ